MVDTSHGLMNTSALRTLPPQYQVMDNFVTSDGNDVTYSHNVKDFDINGFFNFDLFNGNSMELKESVIIGTDDNQGRNQGVPGPHGILRLIVKYFQLCPDSVPDDNASSSSVEVHVKSNHITADSKE
ncbi:hypothetical protein Tco_0833200 [Tanacetum coccineum]